MNRSQANPGSAERGFTLLELVVVMGILSGFLIMLVQLVDAGLRLFGDGEMGQALADRTSQAQRTIGDELRALRGSSTGRDRDGVEDRLLVQWLPIGLPSRAEAGATHVQVLRGAVHLAPDRELALIEGRLAVQIATEHPELGPAELDKAIAEAKEKEPLRGIGNLLLLPWRQENADDAVVELRAGWLLPGQLVPNGDRLVDPFAAVVPGSADLPALLVHKLTVPLLTDLLHVEFAFWSQRTEGWERTSGTSTGGAGPERIWDSARGGWLVDAQSGGEWAFDRGAESLQDPRDDIHPHAIRVLCVAAQPGNFSPEGLLAEPLDADAQTAVLVNGDRFPGALDGGWFKVRGEWLRYDERDGDVLRGLRRGQRGTKAIDHPAGVRVHVGRSVEFVIPVPHWKDDWNG